MPLARQTFNEIVNPDHLLEEVEEEFLQREAAARAQAQAQEEVEAPAPIIATLSIEIRLTETGTCLS